MDRTCPKIKRLRELEPLCYGIVLHLLKNEEEAVKVSQQTLLDLWLGKTGSLGGSPQAEVETLRKLAIRHSLSALQQRTRQHPAGCSFELI
ncbi:hypothetical protein [Paenibacillus hamazuiensis]|uniref:hypothetical protein n=1 Tax=Paenibacillus hamazuiensis TaxID=2936508 RepID=UPI00200F8249|nr:hypothetical protein [Paenibacillus hamazuiensis]